MKYQITLILFSLALFSCKSEKLIDPRPLDQLAFINKTQTLNKTLSKGYNEIRRDELIDSTSKAMNAYLVDTLKGGFKNWYAEVLEITNKPYDYDGVEIVALIKAKMDDSEDEINLSSVTFDSFTEKNNIPLYDSIRNLRVKDLVKVSGRFHLLNNKVLLATRSLSHRQGDKISNPDIKVLITEINKVTKQN